MLNELKKAYELMSDDLSREIFLNRLGFMTATQLGGNYTKSGAECFSKLLIDADLNISELRNAINNRNVVIYGIGYCAYLITALFNTYLKDIEITAYCDKRNKEYSEFFGKRVIAIENLNNNCKNEAIIISPNYVKEEIVNELNLLGIGSERIIYDIYKLVKSNKTEYFDEVLKFDEKEVFVDAGCCDCANSLDFIKRCPSYEKIYAFEPDKASYEVCTEVIHREKLRDYTLYNCGLWNKKDTASFGGSGCPHIDSDGEQTINLESLDELIGKNKVTFIKMDIEGAELKALIGAKEVIKNNKPKLAICVYHKPDDIWEIPLYIHELVPEYKMYMHHYSAKGCSTILYATID